MGKSELQGKAFGQAAHKRNSFSKRNSSLLHSAQLLNSSRATNSTPVTRCTIQHIFINQSSSNHQVKLEHHEAVVNHDIPPLIPRRYSSTNNCDASDIRRVSPRRHARRLLPDLPHSNGIRGSHNAIFPLVFDEPVAPPPKKVLTPFSELSSSLDKPPRKTTPGYSRTEDTPPKKPVCRRSGSATILASLARIRLESSAHLATPVSDRYSGPALQGSRTSRPSR